MKEQRKKEVKEVIKNIVSDLSNFNEENFLKKANQFDISKITGGNLGDILLLMKKITVDKLNEALKIQNQEGDNKEKLGEILVRKKYVTIDDIFEALSYQYNIPFYKKINVENIPIEVIKKIPINYCKKFKVLPIEKRDHFIITALENPTDFGSLDDLRLILSCEIKPVLAKESIIIDAINKVYDKVSTTHDTFEEMRDELPELDLEEEQDLLEADDEAPIIRLVNSLLARAVKEQASDIHIEPYEKDIAVRYRVDGALKDVLKPPKRLQQSITSRIKIMGNLNIAEKRLPQDGRIRIKIAGKDVDIRLATLPTSHGERIVMRILDRSSVVLDLKELGLGEKSYQRVLEIIYKPHGIFLVTGPTGSGKTTTLYACLNKIYSVEKNIITIEDPVEYQLHGIGQIQVNPKIDLTFANGLRSILRQDPDIIMVGEIRDAETAEIAIQASLTGHFVFSTLHTNDSFGAVTRLVDMGIEPFLVSSTLVAVQAQRLIRKVCKVCAKQIEPTQDELNILNIKKSDLQNGIIYKAVGCKECGGTGYKGRSGIYELLPIDDDIRNVMVKNVDSSTLRKHAMARGMKTLREDGAEKVAKGVTTIEEVLKVTQVDAVIE
jgi:general secretion pathway protein E